MKQLILFFVCPLLSFAQTNGAIFENKIYKTNIHTVLLHPRDFELSSPIIALNSGEQLKLSFDDFSSTINSYTYTLQHCTPDWKSSTIWQSDYLKGFYDFAISNYEFSFNTFQKYIHFSENFPNENMQITKSGNYIIKVYQDGDPENAVLTMRFMVVDNQLGIEVNEHPSSIPGDQYTRHEVDFNILPQQVNVTDPYSELKVVLLQNYNWNSAITTLKPKFNNGEVFSYNYDGENNFDAGNEFRYFDIRSLRFQSERISDYVQIDGLYHTILKPDEKRNFLQYRLYTDFDGMRTIDVQEGSKDAVEADYSPVHFTLKSDSIANAEIYVYSALTNWQIIPEAKMKFNAEEKTYTHTLLCKQGYYNYKYAVVKNGKFDENYLEGNFYATENVYQVLVYFKSVIGDYWQLMGTSLVKSTLK